MKLMRWQEMPDFEIYSDQIITIVNQQLEFFQINITKSMINNYVKHKIIPLPIKKKYAKVHITRLIMLSLLKTAFSIDEIHAYFQKYPTEQDYDYFCEIFEKLWHKNGENSIISNIQEINPTILFITTIISKQKAINYLLTKESNK